MFISRRQLLASTAWSALAGAASARRSFAQAEVSETADDFTDWAWVRGQFDLAPEYLHFSQFFIVSHPRPVREAIDRFRRAIDSNPFLTVEHGCSVHEIATCNGPRNARRPTISAAGQRTSAWWTAPHRDWRSSITACP